jgi:thymidylate synthase
MELINETGYLSLLDDVLKNGERKESRNGITYSKFATLLRFNTNNGNTFPLLTSKKVFFRGIVEELLWFLRGSTNSKELEEKGINIWKGNSTREFLDSVGLFDNPEGDLGLIYGFQWRSFNGQIDQIKYLLKELEGNTRRALISAWNPCQLHLQALPPCHILYNFYKSNDDVIHCLMYMRSSDLFLGLPFNIASTALLLMIIAKVMGYKSGDVCISICDCHIYEEHIEQTKEQLNNQLFPFPQLSIHKDIDIHLSIDEKIKWIENLSFQDFHLNNYISNKSIKAPMK